MVSVRNFGLLSSSILYGLGGAAQRLLGFLLLPLFTRFMTPTEYGVVGLLATLPALLLPVFSLGLSASISVCYFAAELPVDRRSVIDTSRCITYISAGVMTILAIVGLDPITRVLISSLEYRPHTLVAIVSGAVSVLCLPLQLEQQFSRRALEFVSISFGGALVTSVASVVLIVVLKLGALGMLLGGLFGQVIVLLLLVVSRRGRQDVKGRASMKKALDLLKQGMPMLPSFLLLFVLQNGVRWPLEWNHGIGAVGLYTIGASFGAAVSLVTSGFVSAWMPWAMTHGQRWEVGRQVVALRLTQYMIGGGFLVLVFFCLAQPVLRILAAPSYFDAWIVVGLAAAANFLLSLFSLILPPVYLAKKVSLVLIAQVVAALVTVGTAYLLMHLGILGAAIAVLSGTVALVLSQIIVNARLTGISAIPIDGISLFRLGLVLLLACLATFWLNVAETAKFALESISILLISAVILIKIFPDKESIVRKFSKGVN